MNNIFTIDVEEHFQVANFEDVVERRDWPEIPSRIEIGTSRLLDLLAAAGAKATWFVLGVVAERTPQVVRRIAEAGHEVASHGWDHRRVDRLTRDGFREDLARAEEAIAAACGVAVRGYRAPHFSLGPKTPWAFDVLVERGYLFDSSLFPAAHPEYGLPRAPVRPYRLEASEDRGLVEVPVAVFGAGRMRLPVAGGGYLRWYPGSLFRYLLRRLLARDGAPLTLYLHPWELDAEQPRVPAGGLERVRHYQGLRGTRRKVRRLLEEFPFGTVSEAIEGLDLPEVEWASLCARAV